MPQNEFQEIGHTGGEVTFNIVTDAQGHRQAGLTRPPDLRRYLPSGPCRRVSR
jgi:hypothetical protein